MKVLITTGGTLGHILPAIELRDALQKDNHEVLMHCFKKQDIAVDCSSARELQAIKGFPLTFKDLKSLYLSVFGNLDMALKARKLLKDIRCDVVVGFGGYASFAFVMGAKLLGIPTVIHEQNVVPGKANKFLGRFAQKILLSFEETKQFFPKREAVYVGCPIRQKNSSLMKEDIYREFGLEKGKKTVLVFGGSQGSQKINEVFFSALLELEEDQSFQVIHITGKNEYLSYRASYEHLKRQYVLFDFLQEMEKAYALSDLVVSRAGAATVFEVSQYQLPSILIPFTHANAHQLKNAEVLARQNLAVIIEEDSLTPQRLKEEILKELKAQKDETKQKVLFAKVLGEDSRQKIINEIMGLVK